MLEPICLWFRRSSEEDARGIDVAKFIRFSQDCRSAFAQGVTYDTVTGLYPQWLPDLKKKQGFDPQELAGQHVAKRYSKVPGSVQDIVPQYQVARRRRSCPFLPLFLK